MRISPFSDELLKLSGPALDKLKQTLSKPKTWEQIQGGLVGARKKAENARLLLKQSASRKNFTVAQSRRGRRPMRVDTMLQKEKDGALYKFTKMGMDAVGVEMVNGKKRVLSEPEAQAVAEKAQEVPTRVMQQIGSMLSDLPVKLGEAGTAEKYLPWYGAAAGGTGGAILGEKLVPKKFRSLGMIGGAVLGTGLGLHSAEAAGKAIDQARTKEAKAQRAAELLANLAKKRGIDPKKVGAIKQVENVAGAGMRGRAAEIASNVRSYLKTAEAWAKLANTTGLPTQFLNVNYTEGESRSGNMPTVNKPKRGDAPTIDQSSRFGVPRGGPEWQNPETSIAPKLAALGRLIVSPTDTHPDRGDDIGPKRVGGEEAIFRFQRNTTDPQPITEVETDGDAYARA